MNSDKQSVKKAGYYLIRNFFPLDLIQEMEKEIIKIHTQIFPRVGTYPDAVNRYPQLIKFLNNPSLKLKLHQIFNEDFKFLQHSDVHAHFYAQAWHRDSACRDRNCIGEDWNNSVPYKILRIGIYTRLSTFELIPGSHITPGLDEAKGISLDISPGDLLLFDPRLYHKGKEVTQEKYSIFFVYGVENVHSRRHRNYYVNQRPDLGYNDYQPHVESQLKAIDLYM